MKKLNSGLLLLTVTAAVNTIGADAEVDYPKGYRSWQHVKSMIIQPGHPLENPFGGLHHIYANAKAMKGLASGEYEVGAVFVFDLLDYVEAGNVIVESDRKRLDVMQYDTAKFSETGNWGYGTFVGDSTTERWDQDVVTACYSCHTPVRESNYVYSKYRP